MKKAAVLLIVLSLMAGCTYSKSSVENEDKPMQEQKTEKSQDNKNQKILIAYFSWADNTIVEDEESSIASALQHYESVGDEVAGEDAISSASIIQPGNVSRMASWIQEDIGGDLFSIQTMEPYPSNYDECLERASDEKAEDARPELKEKVENINAYDTVFIGYPNWWYTVPMPVLTFIEENNLADKNIILFCSHGTGGLARSVEDIQKALPDSAQLETNVIGIYRGDILKSKETISKWLQEIGF